MGSRSVSAALRFSGVLQVIISAKVRWFPGWEMWVWDIFLYIFYGPTGVGLTLAVVNGEGGDAELRSKT